MSYEVQREALIHDAKIWEKTADTLDDAKTSADSLDISSNTTSVVGGLSGFDSEYASLQTFVSGLLGDGGTLTEKMGTTLRDVEKQYAGDDAAALAAIGAEWSPVE